MVIKAKQINHINYGETILFKSFKNIITSS